EDAVNALRNAVALPRGGVSEDLPLQSGLDLAEHHGCPARREAAGIRRGPRATSASGSATVAWASRDCQRIAARRGAGEPSGNRATAQSRCAAGAGALPSRGMAR